ncbi:MAG: nucleotidyl transferase AbiEii/AbiGii toxin family protein [Chloroflexi bacterium]|nr:nucleotidyl transferase AbiEii/AbiGii toxin family protein [Chloroflexota bacterium]
MIGRADLDDRVRSWGLRDEVVEKDYVLGWLLWGIGADPQLSTTWVFKGGTCLKKCYIETYRFSEDLDFTVLEGGPIEPHQVLDAISPVLDRVNQESGIDFSVSPPVCRSRPTGSSSEGRVYYRGPRGAPGPARIKLDLTGDEVVVRPPVMRSISHDYPDGFPAPAQVRCYGFEEVFAEKLRAMGERCRPRDLYDIVNLFRRPDFRQHAALVREVLVQKCEAKSVPVPSAESIADSPMFAELRSEWANMLDHQLRALPDFEHFWSEVPQLFAWLDGDEGIAVPAPVPLGLDERLWEPPPTFWTRGLGAMLEPVRFAAVNRLLVDLRYRGRNRLIEPYSLRVTSAGNFLLHALRADGRGHRAYRLDRIQAVEVTNQPFTPRYAIEFPEAGSIPAPGTPRRVGMRTRVRSGPRYTVVCWSCGRRFRRKKRYTRLRPHKQPGTEWACSSRSGYIDAV